MTKPRKKGLMAQVLSRMTAGDCLISDRHAENMLIGLLNEAEQVSDPEEGWAVVRQELSESWGFGANPEGPSKPFIYRDGVAVIPVHGILLNRFNHCYGFITGYDFIRRQMNAADADEDVNLIVFDHDTPGGEAAGCDELAREIRDLQTPTMALVNSLSASGGFWLAAPCSRIVCAPSGSVGSIGVYILHWNMGKMLAEWGLEATFVKNGEYKVSGNSFEELSEKDRAYFQSMVDERATEFHRAVAEFRGIEESVVKDTGARVMRPTEALALGLIDAAESPTTAVASFVAELGSDDPGTEDQEEQVTMAEMTSEDRAAVAAETKARIKGIMTHEEATGREGLAEHLAYNTDMSVDDAVATLAASPKAETEKPAEDDGDKGKGDDDGDKGKGDDDGDKGDDDDGDKAKGGSQFEQAMNGGKNPEVGPNGQSASGDAPAEGVQANVERILGAQAAVTGRKAKA